MHIEAHLAITTFSIRLQPHNLLNSLPNLRLLHSNSNWVTHKNAMLKWFSKVNELLHRLCSQSDGMFTHQSWSQWFMLKNVILPASEKVWHVDLTPSMKSLLMFYNNCFSVSLYVGNLSYGTTEESIQGLFEENGLTPTSVRLITKNGESRGYVL